MAYSHTLAASLSERSSTDLVLSGRSGQQSQGSLYEPLPRSPPHIRLLTVLSFSKDDVPICLLQHCALGSRSFTALSYTWGPPPATKRVLVNGHWESVRFNLHDFLHRAAKPNYMNTPLFVDALCINQSDREEKEAQVQLMGDVYRQAQKVVVWLPTTRSTLWISDVVEPTLESAISGLEIVIPILEADEKQGRRPQYRHRIGLSIAARTVLRRCTEDVFWTRLWIVQEIVLAQQLVLQLPSRTIDLELLDLAFRYQSGGYTKVDVQSSHAATFRRDTLLGDVSHQAQPSIVLDLRRRMRSNGHLERQPLHELISTFHAQHATVHLDMIYGMLGMADTQVVADYQVPTTDLFMIILIEGCNTIETRADHERSDLFISFYIGLMKIFGLTDMDLAAQIIVREATMRPTAQRYGLLGPSYFDAWIFSLALRQYPLLERSPFLKRIWVLHNTLATFAIMTPCNFSPWLVSWYIAAWKCLPIVRFCAQHALLLAVYELEVELSMPDGTLRTCEGWQKRVHEIEKSMESVENQIPPLGREGRSHPNSESRSGTPSRTACGVSSGVPLLGYVVDQVFVTLLSLVTAWLGFHLGRFLDRLFSTVYEAAASHGYKCPAFLPKPWCLGLYFTPAILVAAICLS